MQSDHLEPSESITLTFQDFLLLTAFLTATILYAVLFSHRFELDVASVRSLIPRDAPESLLSLAFQCVDDEASNRPTGTDVADWLQDLLGDLKSDTCAMPKMRHSESLLTSIEMQFEAEVPPAPVTESLKPIANMPSTEKFTTPTKSKPHQQHQSADKPFLEYTARQIIIATKYTVTPKVSIFVLFLCISSS